MSPKPTVYRLPIKPQYYNQSPATLAEPLQEPIQEHGSTYIKVLAVGAHMSYRSHS